jgi:gamma-glutamylcyclotransferase (GGCT)/AIG2-like uncharacterized protein YtfP
MTTPVYLPFFVYGTLRPGQSNYVRIALYAIRTEPAVAKGIAIYDLSPITGNQWPHAVRTNNLDDHTVGDLVWIDPHHIDEVMAALDEYEDYNPADLEHSEYVRESVAVFEPNGDSRSAWIYIANTPVVALLTPEHRIENGDWTSR